MTSRTAGLLALAVTTFVAGYRSGSLHSIVLPQTVHAQNTGKVFELRTYHTYDGKLDALLTRFRDHTIDIFNRHGMTSVGYWLPTDEPLKGKTLVYVLAFPSREAATKSWAAFRDDPEWKKVAAASEANGKLVEKVDSTFMESAPFSPLK